MVSNDWYNANNWSASFIPTSTTDVTINTGYTYYPIVGSGDAYCQNLTVGAKAKLSVGNGDINISGDVTTYGQLEMTNSNADFFIDDDIYWESGSTANISAGEFWVSGDWEFKNGSNAVLASGYAYFSGTTISYIRVYDASCAFNHVYNWKTSGSLYYSNTSTQSLKINGNLSNSNSTSVTYLNANYQVVLKGQFYNSGHIYGSGPGNTLVFDGTTHSINLNTGDYLNHVIISSTGNTTLSDSLRMNGNLLIESGALVSANY
ncbi:MAG: hypothetical protein HQ542_07680, partial [Bacteroidia bacterium]|nr:hypothetical protein [Bacteroidia bacterium]